MKTLFLLLTLFLSAQAVNINESLLKVHSVLVPKLYLMDYQYEKKVKDNTISIAIVHKTSQYKEAKLLQKQIGHKYSKGIQSYKVKAILVHYSKLEEIHSNIYYLFPAKKDDIQRATKQASQDNALTFSYLSSDLEHGVMISLDVANKIKPILNLYAIQGNNISLRPVLIDISTIYIQGSSSLHKILQINNYIQEYTV